jgi:hypothetical protein
MIIGGSVLGVLLCAIAAIAAIVLIRRRRRNDSDDSDVNFVVVNPSSPERDPEVSPANHGLAGSAPINLPTYSPPANTHHLRRKPVPAFIPGSPRPAVRYQQQRTLPAPPPPPTVAESNPFRDPNPFEDPQKSTFLAPPVVVGNRNSSNNNGNGNGNNGNIENRDSIISDDISIDDHFPKKLIVRNRLSGMSEVSLDDPLPPPSTTALVPGMSAEISPVGFVTSSPSKIESGSAALPQTPLGYGHAL